MLVWSDFLQTRVWHSYLLEVCRFNFSLSRPRISCLRNSDFRLRAVELKVNKSRMSSHPKSVRSEVHFTEIYRPKALGRAVNSTNRDNPYDPNSNNVDWNTIWPPSRYWTACVVKREYGAFIWTHSFVAPRHLRLKWFLTDTSMIFVSSRGLLIHFPP